MGVHVALDNRRKHRINPDLFARKPTDLLEEIEGYKRQTERLARIYDLHRKLGKTLDLNAMIEALSRWLMPMLEHDLLAYRHFGRQRLPAACSCHGPDRKQLMESAMLLMSQPIKYVCNGTIAGTDLFYHLWPLDENNEECLLIIHRKFYPGTDPFCQLAGEFLQELRGPLERALAYEDLYDQARHDTLTGLVNRRVFEERVIQEMANAQRYGHPLVLACLDLDHFKAINDRLGHLRGDAVLREVSATFAKIVRDSDLLARVGGDEFAMILSNTSLESATLLMDRLCHSVTALDICAPGSKPLGVSIGLTAWKPGIPFEAWWNQTDEALYQAKASGRSQVVAI